VSGLIVGEDRGEAVGAAVDECVVGHDRLRRVAAELGEEAQGPLERVCVRIGVLARVQLDVGDPTVVVDHAVEVVVADPAVEVLGRAVAAHAVAGDAEAGELLDVHVQERAGP
jgi:hypothetical protein